MSRFWLLLFLLAFITIALILTRDSWFPTSWRKEWHDAWLSPASEPVDPRLEILEDHRVKLNEMESRYQEEIELQRKFHQEFIAELDRFSQEGDNR